MPYISQKNRLKFNFAQVRPTDAGELNYVITKIVKDYLKRKVGISYDGINEVIGVLECAKLEMYRMIASPYEDFKIKENGDV